MATAYKMTAEEYETRAIRNAEVRRRMENTDFLRSL